MNPEGDNSKCVYAAPLQYPELCSVHLFSNLTSLNYESLTLWSYGIMEIMLMIVQRWTEASKEVLVTVKKHAELYSGTSGVLDI